ncbi:MAG: SsrA-binding protein SmpB [Symbiobacteriaceae bacterium]|nr:SsrA-binding protein SmpB [Symbiobacteriaceae bacterium]
MAREKGERSIADNRNARREYEILERFEAGIALTGTEVKSLRLGRCALRDSYARTEGGECFLLNMHISPYDPGNRFNVDPTRKRKLLLHKREIRELHAAVKEKGLTLIPLRLYFRHGKVKVDLALCRGRKLYDKREEEILRSLRRESDRSRREDTKRQEY